MCIILLSYSLLCYGGKQSRALKMRHMMKTLLPAPQFLCISIFYFFFLKLMSCLWKYPLVDLVHILEIYRDKF